MIGYIAAFVSGGAVLAALIAINDRCVKRAVEAEHRRQAAKLRSMQEENERIRQDSRIMEREMLDIYRSYRDK